jgi:hypothetical protein
MRATAYSLFELVAWPAAAWCALEVVLRGSTGGFDGMAMTSVTGACAALTIVASRWRARQLAGARAG